MCAAYAKAKDGKSIKQPEFESDNSTIASEVTSGKGGKAG